MGAILLEKRCTLVDVCINQCGQMNRILEGMEAKRPRIVFAFTPSDDGAYMIVSAIDGATA